MGVSVVYLGQFPPAEGKYSGGDRRVESLTSGINFANKSTDLIVPVYNYNSKEANQFEKFKIIPLGNNSTKSFFLKRISFWLSLVKFVKKNKVKTVLFYNPTIDSLFSILLLKNYNVQMVMEVCDLMSSSNKGLRKLYHKLSETIIPKFMDLIISISSNIDETIKKTAPKVPILRVPVLVDANEFNLENIDYSDLMKQYDINQNDPIIFYMGGIWKNEGVEMLINAFKKFLDENSNTNAKLLIAGKLDSSNPDFVDVEKFISENSLQNKIIPLGFVDSKTIKKALKMATLVTLTQTESAFNNAGLPTKSAEYAMTGKAILATKVGDIPKYFTHLHNIYFIKNETEIVQAFNELLNSNNSNLEKIGNEAKKTANSFFDNNINGQNIVNTLLKLNNN